MTVASYDFVNLAHGPLADSLGIGPHCVHSGAQFLTVPIRGLGLVMIFRKVGY